MFSSILRSLFFYRRINIVVALAVAVSTAVIGGAMIVGDSVRYSLRQMTRERLGEVTHVVHGRFVREQLAGDLAADSSATTAPAILVTAGMERQQEETVRRAGSVGITAVDESGWAFFDSDGLAAPTGTELILGFRTAGELNAGVGDTVSLWVELPASIPRDSLLGEREETSAEIQLTVRDILPETAGASRFTLNPGQQLPRNAFMALDTLQERLNLQAVSLSKRNPVAKPAMVNTILIHSDDAESNADQLLQDAITASLQPHDLGLRLRVDTEHGYVSVESDRMILEEAIGDAIMRTTDQLGLRAAPTLVYLINEFAAADRMSSSERYSMYSIIAGLPLGASPPLGPVGDRPELADNEILLAEWLQEDLDVQVGDAITARWHEVGSHGDLPEIQQTFTVAGVLPADDPVTMDAGLTPTIAGVTDVESFEDWDQPFEMEMDRITGRDDAWWPEHRATPKAFVSLATAQELWKSRYGNATSVRIAADVYPLPEDRLQTIADQLAERLPGQCELPAVGLAPLPVLRTGLQAAVGANDFTQLFAGFSFFLILSAIILTSLMFRLGIQQRTSQAGLLHAVGLPPSKVRWFFLGEGLLVTLCGAVLGAFAAAGFAQLMIYGLTTWWIGAIGTRFLELNIVPLRLITAAGISVVLAGTVIWWSVSRLKRSSIRDLLSGQTTAAAELKSSGWISLLTGGAFLVGLLLPAAAAGGLLPSGEAFSGLTWNMVAFFVGGAGCLAGGLLLLRERLQVSDSGQQNRTIRHVSGFALANAARSPWRSLLTTALIASATFLIVAVAAGRRNPLSETPDKSSGNGGFRLVAESSQPVLRDINLEQGRIELNINEAFKSAGVSARDRIYSFAMRPGEDASCVNLYQTQLPTLLGATDSFLERGGFRFADTPGENPWTLLQSPAETVDGLPEYPVIGDMNTLMYSLKKGLGDVVLFPNATNPTARLKVVGMLDGSLFQGVLVMSRANLQELDPDVSGFQYFLATAVSTEDADTLATVLESSLNAWGMDTESVGARLAGFLAVQNTYLSTFQLLGGLGLLVGIFGLAVVMVRNVVERRGEIAMLRAVGFTGLRICRLILVENSLLLCWGILLGAVSALLAMLPHLLSTGGDLPWQTLAITLAVVTGTGMLSSVVAVRRALSVSIRETLSVDT